MRLGWVLGWVVAAGCGPTDKADPTDSGTVAGTDPTTPITTTTPTGGATAPTTPTTTPPSACEVSATLTVDSLAVTPGRLPNDRELAVTLSEAATVAAWCVSDTDPADQHLVETAVADTSAALRFQGLRPSSSYTCTVAPTCPTTSAQAAQVVAVTTGTAPVFPTLTVNVDPVLGMTGEYTLLGYRDGACSGNDSWIVLYDSAGLPRWWYQAPDGLWVDFEALYHPEDNTVVWGGGEGTEGRVTVVDLWAGDLYAADLPDWADYEYHHDGVRLDDGRILSLEHRDNSSGNDDWGGWGVRLYNPDTDLVEYEFGSQRYVDEGWLRLAGGFFDQDPYHANWVSWYEDPVGGDRLYLSQCFDWSLMSFDAATGDVRWKVERGLGWTVLDAAGNELDEDELPQCQHGLEVLGDDLLLVYDNGADRGFTRATELQIDAAAMTVTMNWEWTEPDWWESTLGDVDDLGNGRVLITEAHPECWSTNPNDQSAIVEVDRATGGVASRIEFSNKAHTTYRSQRLDGCALLANVPACPARQARLDVLLPLFEAR